MMKRYYTIGMAGHIDHGKTTLTKALTNIDTDRLKEEKERAISIEPGYAPLQLGEGMEVSIVDVPGHEKFIRQMIAGVAGIDLVLLIVAADEGVMPQTVEHLDILNLLGIHQGLIVVTKSSLIDDDMKELVELDIQDQVEGTFFEGAPLHFVDSIDQTGLDELKTSIRTKLEGLPARDARGAFRLPVDQVFTVHGQGTVIRGTVYEGRVQEGDHLEVLPSRKKVRARQLQVHHQKQQEGRAGQRVAINLGGINKSELSRGDVLVSTQYYSTTDTIDIALDTVDHLMYPVKQRGYIKLHLGTAEVYGKIVFFDRNELSEDGGGNILCQLRLDDPVVTKRGDRFILRRPSPVETIGGGEVIDPSGGKYRFGMETIAALEKKKEGTPEDRLLDTLREQKMISKSDLIKETDLNEQEVDHFIDAMESSGELLRNGEKLALFSIFEELLELIEDFVRTDQETHPLREGKDRAVLLQEFPQFGKEFTEFTVDNGIERGVLRKNGAFIATVDFKPGFPEKWAKRMQQVVDTLISQGMEVEQERFVFDRAGLPEEFKQELKHYLIRSGQFIQLDDKHLISDRAFIEAAKALNDKTGESFSLQDAKNILGLSRKYLVPFMELLDNRGYTKRKDDERMWIHQPQ